MAETEAYARELRWILSQAADCLRPLPPGARTWRPLPSANDALTIARHLVGATRGYAVGIGGATAVERDRPAEFRPADDDDDLVGRIEAAEHEVAEVFARVSDDELDRPAIALAHWEGREPPSGTRRDAIVEAIRHGGIHLGELRLTADLALAAAEGRR